MAPLRRVVLVAVLVTVLVLHTVDAGFKLKKLAKAALLGAAIAPRFVPIPIPHHVHGHHHHGHHHKEHHIHVPIHHHHEGHHHGHHEIIHHDSHGHGGWDHGGW
ncbi:zinc transporter zipt-7.2 [Galendromus occidentalis]|uniref:Zinc transporter zipt-7.2 n=1 Tax=Galendromus occidentalis TaxID=34638 RepID=A0AAJ6W0E7_9ACAR|nr:zinc transporter zipt-7.2 [Galendromus occidentalis]